jgi:hypothetical protein
VDFSEASDLFVNIFQILGPNCKFLDYGLILEKLRGLNAKCRKLEFPGIIFLKVAHGPSPRVVNRAGRVRSTVDRRRHGSKAPERGGALIGVRPPAALVHQSSPAGVQKREEHGDLGSGLTGARAAAWRPSDAAARRGHGKLGGEGFRCGRGEERGSVRCGVLRGSSGWLL